MSITDWPIHERPREKLLRQGAKALSDAELLAIFLRTGVKGKTAVDIARELIHKFAGLRGILQASFHDFCEHHGLGPAKYVQLQASMEIACRHLQGQLQQYSALDNPHIVASYLREQLHDKQREVFAAIFLNNQHRLIAYEELFFGSIHTVTVHPREVLKRALVHNAAAVIIAHNHPSGHIEPSQEDKQLTEVLLTALNIIDIRLLDHIIIGHQQVFSFVQKGLLA
jgi:DNA repair protein RadC